MRMMRATIGGVMEVPTLALWSDACSCGGGG